MQNILAEKLNFQTLSLPKTPNCYLMCPLFFCKASPHCMSPKFDYSVEILQKAWNKMIGLQQRVTTVASFPDILQTTYIQRSKWFRFPDSITVQFIAIDKGSTLAIYSASKYGYYDFGVNRKRITDWVLKMQEML